MAEHTCSGPWVQYQLFPVHNLSEMNLEVASKVTSWERARFEDSPLPPLAISACRCIYALTINIARYDACTIVFLIFLYVENVTCFSSVEKICLRRT